MENIGERLEHIRQKSGLNKKDFAKVLGLSPSFYHQLVKENLPIPQKRLSDLAKTFKVNLSWYFTGSGNPFIDSSEGINIFSDKKMTATADFALVPLAEPHLSAGGGSFVLSESVKEYYAFRKDWLSRIAPGIKNLVLMEVSGTSMEPTIADGDTVLIDIGRRRIYNGQIYALGLNDTISIKRLEFITANRIRILSDNRDKFPAFEASLSELRILGQVIWFARELLRKI